MTERKPPEISFASWIDQQINEAAERGAFDNLPGAGKPLPKRAGTDDVQAWLQDYLRREGVSGEELLPLPLRLRKEVERLTGTVQDLRSEQEVREVVAALNQRILRGAGSRRARRSTCRSSTRKPWWPGGGTRGPGRPARRPPAPMPTPRALGGGIAAAADRARRDCRPGRYHHDLRHRPAHPQGDGPAVVHWCFSLGRIVPCHYAFRR